MNDRSVLVAPIANTDTRNSSDIEALRKRVTLLEQVIEGLGVGIAFCDSDGRTELNSTAVATLGQSGTRGGLVSANDGETPVQWSDIPLLDALKSNEAGAVEFCTDSEVFGAKQHLLCTAWPMHSTEGEAPLGAVAILEDITLRERALTQLAVSERAIGQALEHANEASRAKSEFLATMSHEIRSPMTSIIGTAEALTETLLDAQQREYVDLVLKSSDQLLQLINDVLDFAEVEDGEINVESKDFDFLRVVSNVVRLFMPMARSKGLALGYRYNFTLPRRIRGDEAKIRQVLINLVSNAIKFTNSGAITIDIENVEDEHRRYVRLEVRDTGMGIDETQHELIFDAFQHGGENTSETSGGAGLGLAICRRYATLLSGYIGVTSTPNNGASFVFEAPYEASRTTALVIEPKQVRSRKADIENLLRVLVVESNPVNQKLITLQLTTLGHKVSLAADGPTAIERFAVGGFDVVLMSSSLPNSTGIEVTCRLREMERQESRTLVPILGFTSSVGTEHYEACRQAGMNGFVGKRSSLATLSHALFQVVAKELDQTTTPVLNRGTVSELRSLSTEKDFFSEMVKVFWGNATQTVADLRGAARDNDTQAARLLCHRLKGACEALGADVFANACDAMEDQCRAESLEIEEWLAGLREIDDAFAATTSEVQAEVAATTKK